MKLRNKQLCHILSKGESQLSVFTYISCYNVDCLLCVVVKEKSELVQQCDEITQVKDELTAEVHV